MKKITLFGRHTLENILLRQPERLIRLYILNTQDDVLQRLLSLAQSSHVPIEMVARKTLDSMTEEQNHQGVVALCEPQRIFSEQDLAGLLQTISNPLVLVLDGVQDPHNLGACFRTADAAGVSFIIAPKDKSVGLTPIVSKVASGAAEVIPFVQVTNLVRAIETLKAAGIWVYGADAEATKNFYQADFSSNSAIVMGAEGQGLRRLTREHCDDLLAIPMQGTVSSLNISVATGIFLFEVVKQRLHS